MMQMRKIRAVAASLALAALYGCAASPSLLTATPPSPKALVDLTEFALMYTNGGKTAPRAVSVNEAADVLTAYDVVFIGEEHRHPGNHAAQMALFRALHERKTALSLSMEQFERDVQGVVDDYLAGTIGESALKSKGRAWDNYPVSYRPLVEFARERNLPVIAAEAPTMVVRCVGERGPEFLVTMKPEQRPWAAAQLNMGDGPYKEKYMRFAAGDGSHGESGDKEKAAAAALRSFAAQVTRDDTMAESIFLHLQKNPGRQVVHLNGSFHSESFLGTAERLQLRDPNLKIAVVNPISTEPNGALKVSDEDAKTGTFVLLIRPTPKSYVSMDEMRASIREQMKFRSENKCEL
jgi:uncharacterized iron-regulated protein